MNYPAAAKWLDNRTASIEAAYKLSTWDKIAIANWYPKPYEMTLPKTKAYPFIVHNHCLQLIRLYPKYRRPDLGKSISSIRLSPEQNSGVLLASSAVIELKLQTAQGRYLGPTSKQPSTPTQMILGQHDNPVTFLPIYCH